MDHISKWISCLCALAFAEVATGLHFLHDPYDLRDLYKNVDYHMKRPKFERFVNPRSLSEADLLYREAQYEADKLALEAEWEKYKYVPPAHIKAHDGGLEEDEREDLVLQEMIHIGAAQNSMHQNHVSPDNATDASMSSIIPPRRILDSNDTVVGLLHGNHLKQRKRKPFKTRLPATRVRRQLLDIDLYPHNKRFMKMQLLQNSLISRMLLSVQVNNTKH